MIGSRLYDEVPTTAEDAGVRSESPLPEIVNLFKDKKTDSLRDRMDLK